MELKICKLKMFCCYRDIIELPQQLPRFKVLLIGTSMTGKSTFVHNMDYGKERKGAPRCTLGVDVRSITLDGEEGKLIADIWDCAGNPKFRGCGSDYWTGASHAIIFGTKNNQNHILYYRCLPKDVRKTQIKDYDQELEDFEERKEWLYRFLTS